MEQKQIKKVREAVRESRCFKIKAALGIVPRIEDYRMTSRVAKLYYSESRLPREQQIRYLVSKGNLLTLKSTEQDFYNAMYFLRSAYQDAVEEPEEIARKNFAWQNLSESEQSEMRLRAYARNSEKSMDDNECWNGQKEIVRRSASLTHGSPNPEYNFGLLRRIRSGLRYWNKNAQKINVLPATIDLEQNEAYLKHLQEILGERK